MKYYIIKQDPRISDQATTIDSGGLDPLELLDGKILPEPSELNIKLSPRSGNSIGCIIGGEVSLFHKNFITELNKFNIDNIQYFPVNMHAPDGMVEKAYSMANIIGLVDAVDISKSRIKPRAHGGIGSLYSFSIDEEKVKGLRIFRILHAPSLIIIDESLYKELTEYYPPGVLMYPTEEYDGWG
ncbi:imm11 family protein [Formosa sp. PL04]|uniref:imm11 family protein n=1 Tax=Formosa sp. PL04 TaxID=3081755 RepID=UPI002981C7E9|nr:DUF1629 domain-containing protein [Formosa sp. PL04]MDW5289556.1 hypothetical protein [Formosa sp. PL04]